MEGTQLIGKKVKARDTQLTRDKTGTPIPLNPDDLYDGFETTVDLYEGIVLERYLSGVHYLIIRDADGKIEHIRETWLTDISD